MPLKRAVTEFGKTYKDRFALRTYPGTSVPIFIFILGWSRTKPRVTLPAQTMSRCGAVVDDATSARHWKRCSTKLLVPAVKLSAPPTCPSKACGCAAAFFTGHSKYRIGCEDTYECSRCFKRHALCSLCHKLVPFIQAQRHYKSCLRKEHTKGEKWASFFENEDIPDTM